MPSAVSLDRDPLARALRDHGLKLTPPRLAIARALASAPRGAPAAGRDRAARGRTTR
jgi:hypothetical protein